MKDGDFNVVSSFRRTAVERSYKVEIFSQGLSLPVLTYSGLSVFDVQEFLVFLNSKCYVKITCDS